jgi:hypothetical protein
MGVCTLPPMRSAQLTEYQLDEIAKRIWPALNYLGRLEQRMRDEQFPDSDRLLVLVKQANRAVFDVHLELHYLSCDGVGRPRKE